MDAEKIQNWDPETFLSFECSLVVFSTWDDISKFKYPLILW